MATNNMDQMGDTTYTKIFVGGLAWETRREAMKAYFEQFGEITEAVVITDKNTGKSKGYGFVTFKDPVSATRACQDPSPVIDGRRTNCNLACLGSNRSSHASEHGIYRSSVQPTASTPAYHRSTYMSQNLRSAFPYYGYPGHPQENLYSLNYFNLCGGQNFPPYLASTSMGFYQNLHPYYNQYAQNYGLQYPQTMPYSFVPFQYGSGFRSHHPFSVESTTTASPKMETTGSSSSQPVTTSAIVQNSPI